MIACLLASLAVGPSTWEVDASLPPGMYRVVVATYPELFTSQEFGAPYGWWDGTFELLPGQKVCTVRMTPRPDWEDATPGPDVVLPWRLPQDDHFWHRWFLGEVRAHADGQASMTWLHALWWSE